MNDSESSQSKQETHQREGNDLPDSPNSDADSVQNQKREKKTDKDQPRGDSPQISSSELREYRKGRADGLVGIFMIIALGLLFGAYCWWKNYSPLNPPQLLYVAFNDVASLNQQAAVYVHGVRVGSVDDIKIREKEDDVLVRLRVNTQKCKVPVGSNFIILPNGVVGAKYVEIVLPESQKHEYLTDKTVTRGDDPVRLEIVVNELVGKLEDMDFETIQNKLVRSLDKMSNVADHVSTLSKKMEPVAAHAQATADSVNALAQQMQAPVKQMHQILDQKHPLMHMVFGRPGHIKGDDVKEDVKKDTTDAQVTPPASDSEPKKKKRHKFFGL